MVVLINEIFFGSKLIVSVWLVGFCIVNVVVDRSPGNNCPANQLVMGNGFEEN